MVQTHRCPATVSGTKSAETTEGSFPWEGAESRDMTRARRPALHGAETFFRGKGTAACLCRPRPLQVGVFFCVLLPISCGTALLPSLWGKRRRGGSKPWFLPQH